MKSAVWLGLFVVAAGASDALGTVLIFRPAEGEFADFAPLPQGYGDRVEAEVQDGFLYSLDGGPTANVIVHHSTEGLPQLYTWANDFGDLHNVVFAQEPLVFEIVLEADPGFFMGLNSFDMASWPHIDYVIDLVEVVDETGTPLYRQENVPIYGDPSGPEHTHFDFEGVFGQSLTIRFDSRNTGDSDDVGITNINFSQAS